MAEDGLPGAMVAMSSVAGRGPRADAADYAASKAAVISVVQSAAVALAPHRIRVNALCPGMVDTPMTQRNTRRRAQVESRSPEDVAAAMLAKIPLGRLSTPKEIADIATLLIGENFNYVTGQAINVCGGLEFD
jgi:NAD(P)-dependent dehydrogenase (short-subunit alcohol dehydrogenase family)